MKWLLVVVLTAVAVAGAAFAGTLGGGTFSGRGRPSAVEPQVMVLGQAGQGIDLDEQLRAMEQSQALALRRAEVAGPSTVHFKTSSGRTGETTCSYERSGGVRCSVFWGRAAELGG